MMHGANEYVCILYESIRRVGPGVKVETVLKRGTDAGILKGVCYSDSWGA